MAGYYPNGYSGGHPPGAAHGFAYQHHPANHNFQTQSDQSVAQVQQSSGYYGQASYFQTPGVPQAGYLAHEQSPEQWQQAQQPLDHSSAPQQHADAQPPLPDGPPPLPPSDPPPLPAEQSAPLPSQPPLPPTQAIDQGRPQGLTPASLGQHRHPGQQAMQPPYQEQQQQQQHPSYQFPSYHHAQQAQQQQHVHYQNMYQQQQQWAMHQPQLPQQQPFLQQQQQQHYYQSQQAQQAYQNSAYHSSSWGSSAPPAPFHHLPTSAPLTAHPLHQSQGSPMQGLGGTAPGQGAVQAAAPAPVPQPAQPQGDITQLLTPPGRHSRPKRIALILRGLPGSGKSHAARLIREKECEAGGEAPRILSLDDYFMTEVEREVEDEEGGGRKGRKRKVQAMEYSYEPEMEAIYKKSLLKSFQRTTEEGRFRFVVVDAPNTRVADFKDFWVAGQAAGYEVFVVEMTEGDPQVCFKRNQHGRSVEDVYRLSEEYEPTPGVYSRIDPSGLWVKRVEGGRHPSAR